MQKTANVLMGTALVYALVASLFFGGATGAQGRDERPRATSVQRVRMLLDRDTDAAITIINQALQQVIQPELDRLGSEMNARQVVMNALDKRARATRLETIRARALDAGYSEEDAIVQGIDEQINALKN